MNGDVRGVTTSLSCLLGLMVFGASGAIRAQDLAALDTELRDALMADKGEPFEVLARMRAVAAADPTHDLFYLLVAGSAGRKRDGAESKACAERFDAAWKAREASGLDVEAMKQRLDAIGVKQACEDLGLTFDPAALRKLGKEDGQALLPSRKGGEALLSAAKRKLTGAENEIQSTRSAIDNAKERIRTEQQRIAEAKKKLKNESDEREKRRLKQRILDCEPNLDRAIRDRDRNTEKLPAVEAQRSAAAAELRQLEKRLGRLFAD